MSSIHRQAKDLFLAALSYRAADRERYLAEACGGDELLRAEVESLLAFHVDSTGPDSHATATPPQQDGIVPGDLFATRYRMIARIGRGGMGDVWHAEDLVLETPVALKVLFSTRQDARVRILNEVRLARQITHPAVCRVFDVGEADGRIFFSMELVRGEDLAALLQRTGRLPPERVVAIGQQLCAGLAAAHARGVLHRDLKPANVLIDAAGHVRITDFGIAVTRTESGHHTLIGTPAYMAPEQLTTGTPLSERTDLYALGLVLFELATGERPVSRSVRDGVAPPASVPGVGRPLERLILQALSPDPKDRPASALEMAARLPSAASPTRAIGPRTWFGVAAAAVLVCATTAALLVFRPGPSSLSEQDPLVIADFLNTTGEPVFDGALKVALAVALEQSPYLKVFPDERVQETLALMNRSRDERVTRSLAREIAQREQLKAFLAGSITKLGRNYVVLVETVNARTDEVLAREQMEVSAQEEVLSALGAAASRLREKLGESLASIEKFNVPLPRATTPSLEALHAYALALDEGRVNPRLEAIPHLKRAIDLDPDFALALALLSGVYANTGQTTLAPEFSRRAFELRDRVSERERFFIGFRYYRDAVQAWDKALELARQWTAAYPREAVAFNSLGIALLRFGQYEDAIPPLREAIRLDPKFVPLYSNLAGVLMALNRFSEAKAVLQDGFDQQIDFTGMHRISYLIALVEEDTAAMERHLKAGTGVGETNAAFGWQATGSAFFGRVADARAQFQRGIRMAAQNGFKEVAAQLAAESAEINALVSNCPGATRDVAAALAMSRDVFSLERAARALALCGIEDEATAILRELKARFPEATLVSQISLPVGKAVQALQRGEGRRAVDLLQPVRPYDHSAVSGFWPGYLRGQAYLELKDGRAAAAEFRAVLDHRGEDPDSLLYPLSYLGLARATALSGDIQGARNAYQQLLRLWEHADRDIAQVTEARLELARLPSVSSPKDVRGMAPQ